MIETKVVELWDGKKVIGTVRNRDLIGRFCVFLTVSILKEEYNKKYERIKVPIIIRPVWDNGIDFMFRRCLDVRRKSKRQIKILLKDFQ